MVTLGIPGTVFSRMMTSIHMVPSLATIHHHHGTDWPYACSQQQKTGHRPQHRCMHSQKQAPALDQRANAVFHVPEKKPCVCLRKGDGSESKEIHRESN
jgi:hypothetical protein